MAKTFDIKPTMDTMVDYTNPILDSYRSLTHDAILIYGFVIEQAASGAVKAKFSIEDGLRYKSWLHIMYESYSMTDTLLSIRF